MINFDGVIADIISWVIVVMSYGILLGGALWLIVGILALIEGAITAMIVRLKAYPILVDFIFNRRRFKNWLEKNKL